MYKKQVSQQKDTIMYLEKEKEELLAFKTATTKQNIESSSEYINKSMSQLNLREGYIQALRRTLIKKESCIASLNALLIDKDYLISKEEAGKKEMKTKCSKENTKLIGKAPLCGGKHILWDYLLAKITKFRGYLIFVKKEQALA